LATGADDRPIVFVTESLGSKFLFDAVRMIWNEHQKRSVEAQQRLALRIASIQMIFMVANQIPLLDQASPVTPVLAPTAMAKAPLPNAHSPSVHAFLSILSDSRLKAPKELQEAELGKHTIVAFSDPNDLLSYRLLLADLETNSARLINVIVSNDKTLIGWVEHPANAHCGYSWNPHVIAMIVKGYDSGKPLPQVAGVPDSSCLSQ
jgi:hypothetical protein